MQHTTPENQSPSLYRQEREPVLLVGHGDYWVEVFAEKHVDVHIAMAPYLPDAGAKGELLAEEHLDITLPWKYRNLYAPGNRRGFGLIERITPADLHWRQHNVDLSASIGRAGEILKGAHDV